MLCLVNCCKTRLRRNDSCNYFSSLTRFGKPTSLCVFVARKLQACAKPNKRMAADWLVLIMICKEWNKRCSIGIGLSAHCKLFPIIVMLSVKALFLDDDFPMKIYRKIINENSAINEITLIFIWGRSMTMKISRSVPSAIGPGARDEIIHAVFLGKT